MSKSYRFTFGPWNISMGADPFGPTVRKEVAFAAKIREYKKLGFDGVQCHDDDVVEADLPPAETLKGAAKVKKMFDSEGLFCEFIATPRLWEHPKTIDGGYTSNSASERKYAIERSKRAIDIANAMGTKDIVLWLAREGTYIREAKDPIGAVQRILDAVNALLEYDKTIRILGEMKPNEPMDQAYMPTVGHFLCYDKTIDPSRSGVLIELRHSILAGLDPSDDMACALWHNKLWSVHLNDQNGLKYDQDKSFGSVDLRRAFNTVWVLERSNFDGCVGLDVKAMRTTKAADQTKHLANSKEMFLRLLDVVRSVDNAKIESLRAERDYEGLEMYILKTLMGD